MFRGGCKMRADICISATGAEISSTAASSCRAPHLFGGPEYTSTAEFATTESNLLNCWRRVGEGVGMCVGEHRNGCLSSLAQIAEVCTYYCCGARYLRPSSRSANTCQHASHPSAWCPLRTELFSMNNIWANTVLLPLSQNIRQIWGIPKTAWSSILTPQTHFFLSEKTVIFQFVFLSALFLAPKVLLLATL